MERASKSVRLLAVVSIFLGACTASVVDNSQLPQETGSGPVVIEEPTQAPPVTPYPTRPPYGPGELVDYVAQTGDTLPALASHFNTSVAEIREANPIIPEGATTMPPGMPMKIPIYYLPFWGNPYQILPDSLFINGPAQIGFDTGAFMEAQPGWLKSYYTFAGGKNRSGAEIVDYVALSFSISPRLLLALLEYQAGALTQPGLSSEKLDYPLGYHDPYHKGVYLQLVWAANTLNNGYYGWRLGTLTSFDLANGRIDRPDPWQNAGSVAFHHFFAQVLSAEAYEYAVSSEGFAALYRTHFGDPWANVEAHIPGSLYQPGLLLPFEPRKIWAYTGGPHTGWGNGQPLAAIDFAPPSVAGGCTSTDEWVTAVADGVIARSEPAIIVLDLDRDGDERTGWTIFYLHLESASQVPQGVEVTAGQPLGHPSCEGGDATGTHVHIARKYNGEWIPAGGTLAFDLEGWVAAAGYAEYFGTLTRNQQTVTACTCSDQGSHIQSEGQP